MTVFVLGAGASLHAGYPAAMAMGEELATWAEQDETEGLRYRDDFRELRNEFGSLSDFERVTTVLLEDKAAGKRQTIPDVGTAISKFFDSIRNRPAQLYDRLAKERVQRGDVIITFNYDMAIERSLKAAGVWNIIDGYGSAITLQVRETPTSGVRVLKPHGSTNWWGSLFGGALGYGAAHNSIGERPVFFFEPDFEFLGHKGVRDPKAPSSSALLSALIWPAWSKQFFMKTAFGNEWEPFWNSLWLEAEQVLRKADEIVVIGYSLLPADERARELLLCKANRNARVAICSRTQSERIANEFRSHLFKCVHVPTDPTLSGWLDAE